MGVQELKAQAPGHGGPLRGARRHEGHFHFAEKKATRRRPVRAQKPSAVVTGIGHRRSSMQRTLGRGPFDRGARRASSAALLPDGSKAARNASRPSSASSRDGAASAAARRRARVHPRRRRNIAHQDRPAQLAQQTSNSGFLPEERAWLTRSTAWGFVDVFRRLNPHPDQPGGAPGGPGPTTSGSALDYRLATPGIATRRGASTSTAAAFPATTRRWSSTTTSALTGPVGDRRGGRHESRQPGPPAGSTDDRRSEHRRAVRSHWPRCSPPARHPRRPATTRTATDPAHRTTAWRIVVSDAQTLAYGMAYAYAQDNVCMTANQLVTVRGERSRHFGGATQGCSARRVFPERADRPLHRRPHGRCRAPSAPGAGANAETRTLARPRGPVLPGADHAGLTPAAYGSQAYRSGDARGIRRQTELAARPEGRHRGAGRCRPRHKPPGAEDVGLVQTEVDLADAARPYAKPALLDSPTGSNALGLRRHHREPPRPAARQSTSVGGRQPRFWRCT